MALQPDPRCLTMINSSINCSAIASAARRLRACRHPYWLVGSSYRQQNVMVPENLLSAAIKLFCRTVEYLGSPDALMSGLFWSAPACKDATQMFCGSEFCLRGVCDEHSYRLGNHTKLCNAICKAQQLWYIELELWLELHQAKTHLSILQLPIPSFHIPRSFPIPRHPTCSEKASLDATTQHLGVVIVLVNISVLR